MADGVASGIAEVRWWRWSSQRWLRGAFQTGQIRGFTLIELLVVIAIIAISSGDAASRLEQGENSSGFCGM